MGSLCSRRSEEENLTEAELRERRLKRFAGGGTGPHAGSIAVPLSMENSDQPQKDKPAPSVSTPLLATAPVAKLASPVPPPASPKRGIAKVDSTDTIASKAARVMKPLAQHAEYRTIELVSCIVKNILNQPSSTQVRSLGLASLRERLPPDLCEQEMAHLCSALKGIGFIEVDDGCGNARLEMVDATDLALARELAQKIEKTRTLWKPAHVDRQLREEAGRAEVMSTTGCSKQHALDALAASGSDTVFAIGLISDGPKDKEGKPMVSPKYILNITSRGEESIRQIWSSPYEPLAEYQAASHAICLSQCWVARTKLGRILSSIDAEFKEDPACLAQMEDRSHFEGLLHKLIMKAYKLSDPTSVGKQVTIPCGWEDKVCIVFDTVCDSCFIGPVRMLGGGSPPPTKYMSWCLQTLLMFEEPSVIEIKLFELCDVAPRCGSARKQTFNSLITHCCALRDANKMEASSAGTVAPDGNTQRELAVARVQECFEDFLDDHKAQAFTSAFIAPARYYLHHTSHEAAAENVVVHGSNWYLTLVHSTLGMPLPLSGHYDDHIIQHSSLVDYWQGLTQDAWSFFSDMKNFGKYSADLPRFSEEDAKFVREEVKVGELPPGHCPGPKAMCLGNSAANPDHGHAVVRKRLAVYLERFAHFFETKLFVQKAFETLNSEGKPEHVGFRSATQTLYSHYRVEVLNSSGPDTLLEHCYKDEYFTQLDVTCTAKFFFWLGFIKDVYEIADDYDSDESDLFS